MTRRGFSILAVVLVVAVGSVVAMRAAYVRLFVSTFEVAVSDAPGGVRVEGCATLRRGDIRPGVVAGKLKTVCEGAATIVLEYEDHQVACPFGYITPRMGMKATFVVTGDDCRLRASASV